MTAKRGAPGKTRTAEVQEAEAKETAAKQAALVRQEAVAKKLAAMPCAPREGADPETGEEYTELSVGDDDAYEPQWRHWYSMAVVELWQAVHLSYDLEPDKKALESPDHLQIDWEKRLDVAMSHVIAGSLAAKTVGNTHWVALRAFASLADRCHWHIPEDFPREERAPGDASLNESERRTVNKMLLAMAVSKYDYDPDAKRNSATGENAGSIPADAQRLGLSIDAKTVSKYLKQAAGMYPNARKRQGSTPR